MLLGVDEWCRPWCNLLWGQKRLSHKHHTVCFSYCSRGGNTLSRTSEAELSASLSQAHNIQLALIFPTDCDFNGWDEAGFVLMKEWRHSSCHLFKVTVTGDFNAVHPHRATCLNVAVWARPCFAVTDLSDSAAYYSEEAHSYRCSNVRICTWISQGSKYMLWYDFHHG